MISIGPEADLSAFALPTPQRGDSRTDLGQEDFLTLMLAQLRNQDPFQPIESGDFLGQMAQFSTVSSVSDMSESLAALSETLLSSQVMQASTMIGRSVLAESGDAELRDGGVISGAIDVPPDSGPATVRITDAAGQLLRELTVETDGRALPSFEWDGTTSEGQQAPPGQYQLSATIRDGQAELGVPTYVRLRVESVTLSPDGAGALIITEDGQQLRFSQIRAVL